MKTLRDCGTDFLHDAPTGQLIPDDPADYEVLHEVVAGGYTFRLVRGPSGQVDVEGPEAGHLNRDQAIGPDELKGWIEANYP